MDSFEWLPLCGEMALVGCGGCAAPRAVGPAAPSLLTFTLGSLNAKLSCVLGQKWCSEALFVCLPRNSSPKILALKRNVVQFFYFFVCSVLQ